MFARGFVVVLALAGCSQILGLTAPRAQRDAPGGDDDAPKAADFSLRVTTASPRVPQGASAALDVAVTRDGFDGAITVDIPAAPTGVTVTPATIAAGSNAGSLTLAGSNDLTAGSDLSLDVVATGGGIEHDVMVTAVVALHPGSLDPTFGSDGTGIASFVFGSDEDDFFTDVDFGPGQTFVAVGGASLASSTLALVARVTFAGALDTTFGSGGVTETSGDPGSAADNAELLAVTRLSSGTIVGVGDSPNAIGSDIQAAWATAFESNGAVDTEFAGFGSYFDNTQEECDAIAALADGELLIVETSPGGNGSAAPTLVGLDSGGGPDDAFDGDGSPLALPIRFSHFLNGDAAAIAVDGAGTGVYIGGGLEGSAGGIVLHVSGAGVFDSTFAGSGEFALGSASTDATAIAVQADGDVLVGGPPAFLARVTPAGDLDPAFGSGGIADLGTIRFFAIVGLAIQSDGKILVAGNELTGGDVAVIRLLPDGTFDPSYGIAGATFISSFSLSELRVAPDGSSIGVGLDLAGHPLSAGLFRLAP